MPVSMRFSFRLRLLLTFWFVIVFVQWMPIQYYSRTLRRDLLDEEENKAIRQLHLVHWLLIQRNGFPDGERFNEWLTELGEQLQVRITYMATGGRIIADSQVAFADIPGMENHANRPEIVAARGQEVGSSIRYSGTVNNSTLAISNKSLRIGIMAWKTISCN